ncbi:flagellar hook-associated protein FlgK [Phenylobacterium sp.]|uniref:flagellar hook-associated protein FlgK n=1 Tax=Phenylobacterium sp. TaxID=1871053 RepID=UPI0025EB9A26|nr:flagellar hook-associated protein FlgK [Phenylobacterium sp.]MCA6285728.1 flagellar hook-associated protein FlgK [Phenylobacterium sp.]MCA6311603.1 flagellar hook-associated protein FlgK [Phenylobacterium sp.]MCA6324640.1 flagellar hook-associated protein FlgK [Phenylobacterium sp.]MCA6337752.1 flagellar hook-associated protein FlgK [Phenylobacterium sp.]MCA6340743.1 flagellar hook-associated protein FlgK [Phenylobacterium sp.]
MSLTAVLSNAASGVIAAQSGLRTSSDNIANVNTPGYVRKKIDQEHRVYAGVGSGTEVSGVRRVIDNFLVASGLTASSATSRWNTVASSLDNAQSLFGDPNAETGYFANLDEIWTTFQSLAQNPTSGVLRSQSVTAVKTFLDQTGRINDELQSMTRFADSQASAAATEINDLLSEIAKLNLEISKASVSSRDTTGPENVQAGLIEKLAKIMDIRLQPKETGGFVIRSAEGVELAGDSAATVVYRSTNSTPGYLAVQHPVGPEQPITVSSGDLRGFLDLRNTHLPDLSRQLGEFAARAAERINAAHNASTSSPARALLQGRDTGLDLPTAIDGFSGQTTLAITNASGVIQRTVSIDFTAGTMSVNSGPPSAFTPASFLTNLNTALGAFGSASFSNRALSLTAAAPNGIAIDEGTSQKAGRAFSHFFGLNDLIRSEGQTIYETGLKTTDPHGFTPGQTISFRLSQGDGKPIRDVTVTVPAAGTMQDLLDSLNANTTGVGLVGAYALDAQGQLSFTPSTSPPVSVSVSQDLTSRGPGGPSISALFGLGVRDQTSRAGRLSVDPDIAADPNRLATSRLNLSVAAGAPAISPGNGQGANALAAAGETTAAFDAVGNLGALNTTLIQYAAQFSAAVGSRASAAETQRLSSEAISKEVDARRESVEGVNLDEELVRLTTYQQAFNASARMIQAAREMFEVLTSVV